MIYGIGLTEALVGAESAPKPHPFTPKIGKPHIRKEMTPGAWAVSVRGRLWCHREKIITVGWGAQFPAHDLKWACEQLAERAARWP